MHSRCCYICFSQLPQSQLQLVKVIVDIAHVQVIIVTSWYPKTPFYHVLQSRARAVLARGTLVLGRLRKTSVVLLVTGDGVVGDTLQAILCLACRAAGITDRRLAECC